LGYAGLKEAIEPGATGIGEAPDRLFEVEFLAIVA
jgi:hypothetical protein